MTTKISLKFANFNVPKCINELDITAKSKSDASYGMPLPDATAFSSTEIEIEHEIIKCYSDGVSNCNSSSLEEALQNAASLRQADGHDGQISSLKINLKTLYAECKNRLSTEYTIYRKDKDYLDFFRKDNSLLAKANLKTDKQKAFSIFIVMCMFLFEVTVNTSLMSGAISGGALGALALASVIAFVNIVSSFMVGHFMIPNLYHKQKSKTRTSWIGLAFYVPLILYINFALGVFRTLSEKATQTFNQAELQNVAAQAAWPFDNLSTNTLDSNGLIIIGLLFAVISILDGMYFDELYPGYAKVSKEAAKSEDNFNRLKREGFDLLQSMQKQGNQQITGFKKNREDANRSWANNIDSVQAGFTDYESWVKSLTKAGNNLLQQYRSTNKAFRSTEVPKYFSEIHDFGFEVSATQRFRSLIAVNLSDESKDKQYRQANEIIVTEYNAAIIELNTIYAEIIDAYQDYLSRLR